MHGGGFFRDVFLLRRGLYRRPAVRSISRRALPARERANRRVIRVLPPPRRFGGGARAGNPFVPDVYRFCRGGVPAKGRPLRGVFPDRDYALERGVDRFGISLRG